MVGKVWDEKFMALAHHIAEWSKESGRRVGAVVVGPDREIRSTGFNGLPRGVIEENQERHKKDNGEKYLWSCHAEQNAIFNAARIGTPLKGCTIYVPWFPCMECAKAIVQSGINKLVAYEPDYTDPKWGREFERVSILLKEAKVKVEYIDKLKELSVGGGEVS